MSVTLAPPPFLQFLNPNNSGSPAVAYQLFTYQAGTSIKQATWTDSTQITQNANPLELDGNGVGTLWGDPALAYKLVWAPANDMDPPSSQIRTIDNFYFPATIGALAATTTAPILPSLIRTPLEIANGVMPTNYAYLPGDIRRYGNSDPTAITSSGTFNSSAADSTTGILAAFQSGHTVLGGGRNCGYKCAQSIPITNNMDFDAQDCTIYWTADVAGFTNSTGGAVLYPNIRGRLRARSNVASTHAMLDVVDVNRGYFDIAQADRGVAAMSWAYAVRIRTSVSTSLWNKFMPMEVNTVNTGAISIEAVNCNENVFFGFKLLNDATILLPYGLKITGGGGNQFFDLDLEASFSTNGAGNAYGVQFGGSENRIFNLRTEGYSNSASFNGINWNGVVGNQVLGHYFLGFGGVSAYTGTADGNTWFEAGGTGAITLGGSSVVVGKSTSAPSAVGSVGLNTTSDRFMGVTSAVGARDFTQTPALETQDMNGNALTNVSNIILTGAASSPGAGKVNIGSTNATTVGAAGGATALPATPLGYLIGFVGTQQVKIPYYNP